MKSRRKEFRYGDFTIPVKFKTAYEEGMDPMEVFLRTIDTDDPENPIEAKAVVLRIKGETLAAQFSRIPPASQKLLRRYFANKLRNQ